jgi:hypothetical protein
MKERAQSGRAAPTAPQIVHKKTGESAAQDGVLIYNPVDEELEISIDGAWNRILRNEVKVIDFDQNANIAVTSGQMAWNAAAGTLDLGMNNGAVVLQIGQEIHYRVKNRTGSTIANGAVVSAAGTEGASGHILIQKFIADGSIPPRFLLGVATEDIPNGSLGYVTHFGRVDFNTSGFTSGAILYPSATVAGALTQTAPTSPHYEMPICYAINSKNNGQIFVRVQTGYNIDELYDVQINTPVDGNFLRYVAADGRWENRTANLDALSDVVITAAATGEVLRYNGTNWVDGRVALDDLSDSSSLPRIVSVPATATSAGAAGQIAYSTTFLYICVATNTWRRVAIAAW